MGDPGARPEHEDAQVGGRNVDDAGRVADGDGVGVAAEGAAFGVEERQAVFDTDQVGQVRRWDAGDGNHHRLLVRGARVSMPQP
jgi:hypothetical protein